MNVYCKYEALFNLNWRSGFCLPVAEDEDPKAVVVGGVWAEAVCEGAEA